MAKQTYANGPWSYPIDTSMEAADRMAEPAQLLRDKVLSAVAAAGRTGITVVEMAERHGLDRMSIQPRFSELRAERKISDSGLRRRNPSGVRAICWVLPEHLQNSGGA